MINVDDRLLTRLDEKEMWLLMHIVKRLGADGTCWPSNETLLADTGWKDIRTLRRVKKQLEDKGMMQQDARFNDKKEQRSNTYKVLTDMIGVYKTANTLQTGGTKNAPATGVQKMHPPGVHEMQGAGVHEMHHEVLSIEVLNNEQRDFDTEKEFKWFWETYNYKVGKHETELFWYSLDFPTMQKIREHLPAYMDSKKDTLKRYWKKPANYLKEAIYNDEIVLTEELEQEEKPRAGFVLPIRRTAEQFKRRAQ